MMRSFYTLFILSSNSLGEFCVDRSVVPTLDYAYRTGQDVLSHEDVYGYVIVKTNHDHYGYQDTWQVINETVYGCDYTVYEHNGTVYVKEGRDSIVLV